MARWVTVKPPKEVQALGPPERVYRSNQASRGMRWTTYVFGTLALLAGGGLWYLKAVAEVVPPELGLPVYAVSAVFFGAGLVMYLHLAWKSIRRPKYLYALYREGMVSFQDERWRIIPWVRVTSLEQQAAVPYLCIDGHQPLPLPNDFPDGAAFYADVADFVHERSRLSGIVRTSPPALINRSAILCLLGGFGLIATTIALAVHFQEWLVLNLRPAAAITAAELLALQSPHQLPHPWVRLNCPKVIPTGVAIGRPADTNTPPEAKLVLVPIKDRFLAAAVPSQFNGEAVVTGELGVWRVATDDDAPARYEALERLGAAFPRYKDRLLPYQFNATYQTDRRALFLGLELAVALLIGIGLLVRAWVLVRRPATRETAAIW